VAIGQQLHIGNTAVADPQRGRVSKWTPGPVRSARNSGSANPLAHERGRPPFSGDSDLPRIEDLSALTSHIQFFPVVTLMHVRGISAISAEPILGLVRAHARRTVLGRLGVVYEIIPSPSTRPASETNMPPLAVPACREVVPNRVLVRGPEHVVIGEFGAKPNAMVPLGEALYMDSIIEGGVDGEALPVTLDRGVALNMQAHMPGELVNLQG